MATGTLTKLNDNANSHDGFTLIEVVIVMLILSIVATITAWHLNVIGLNKRLITIAEQITRTLETAQKQALLQPTIIGFAIDEDHYRFYEYYPDAQNQDEKWRTFSTGSFQEKKLPSGIQLTLTMNTTEQKDANIPIVVLPSGYITPFQLTISAAHQDKFNYQLTAKANGEITSKKVEISP